MWILLAGCPKNTVVEPVQHAHTNCNVSILLLLLPPPTQRTLAHLSCHFPLGHTCGPWIPGGQGHCTVFSEPASLGLRVCVGEQGKKKQTCPPKINSQVILNIFLYIPAFIHYQFMSILTTSKLYFESIDYFPLYHYHLKCCQLPLWSYYFLFHFP